MGMVCFLVFASIGFAEADIIWQVPVTISGDADISTAGTTVRAWSATSSSTINGVTFSQIAAGNPQGDFIIGGSGFGGTSSIFNNLSAPYRSLLDSAVYRANGDSIMTINLNALTAGRTYEFQAFVNDSRNNTEGVGGSRNRWSIFDSGAGTAQTASVFQPYRLGTNNIGQYVKGTFTATSNAQLVRILGNAELGPQVSLINAYQVRDITAVPEPSSMLLLSSVAGLGGMFLRKRRRNKLGPG